MAATYDRDVVAWAAEQAELLRAGKFSELDIEHVVDAIEDVGKAEQFDFARHMAVLLADLLKWTYQPALRGKNLQALIEMQRKRLQRRLSRMPSLGPMLTDDNWIADMWGDARYAVSKETELGFDRFPELCPWPLNEALRAEFFPEQA